MAIMLLTCSLLEQTHMIITQENNTNATTNTNVTAQIQSTDLVHEYGLPEQNRQQMANLLNVLLADEYVLYTKTLRFHWNLKGKHFGALHLLFEKQYEILLAMIDSIAERSVQLGFNAGGSLREYLEKTTLSENYDKNPHETAMITLLLIDHEMIIKELHAIIETSMKLGDHATNNFLSEVLEKHEKMAWMLRAHLEQ